ncbi:protein kinase [Saccharothrix sp. S26]|uniref:serine/threonine-protein kinase n=1 Tax=Saccharothrix sp. S26 TaxID=2907215 RepID=UPI001F41F14A|nr:serine/threonine-protein kinase [Saccharothrix sp. S26]MCE6996145.1 protein kinase [Saccharothrix sp. S26]
MSSPRGEDLLADRYELRGVLGAGGMAEVHRAWDTALRREVAVKLFRPGADLDDRRRFDNEVRTLAGLSHPGLVPVHDAGIGDRGAFLVLGLVDGCTLRDHIARGPLDVEEVSWLGARLSEALAYVHDRGVVHRDVKPSNILLDRSGVPYLADFGLAHLTGSTRFTRTGQVVGTPAYLAPEQVRGAGTDTAADVYALGLVLLECLTGRREYDGGDFEAAVARLHRPPDIPSDLPADLVRLLSLMTSLSPRRRPTAHDCARALDTGTFTAIEILTTDTDDREEPVPHRVSRPSPMKSTKALVASLTGLAGAVCAAWALSPTSAPATSAPDDLTQPTVTVTAPLNPATATVEPPADQRPDGTVTQQPPAPGRYGREQAPGQVKQDKAKPVGKDKKAKP